MKGHSVDTSDLIVAHTAMDVCSDVRDYAAFAPHTTRALASADYRADLEAMAVELVKIAHSTGTAGTSLMVEIPRPSGSSSCVVGAARVICLPCVPWTTEHASEVLRSMDAYTGDDFTSPREATRIMRQGLDMQSPAMWSVVCLCYHLFANYKEFPDLDAAEVAVVRFEDFEEVGLDSTMARVAPASVNVQGRYRVRINAMYLDAEVF